jgi:Protein of unknown function (DUF2612)
MPFDTLSKRERALGYGRLVGNWPYPSGSVDADARAYLWGSYGAGYPPNPYYIPDHVARAQSLLIEQFKRKERIRALVAVYVAPLQELEDVFSDLYRLRDISSASGAQLDTLGEIVGQPREGRTDTEYRAAIRFRIQLNGSSGQPDTVSEALRFFTSATQVRLIEKFPGAVTLFTDGTTIPSNLQAQMQALVPAAVRVTGVALSYGDTPFEFSGEGGVPYGEGDGLSELNYLEGGQPIGGSFCELAT